MKPARRARPSLRRSERERARRGSSFLKRLRFEPLEDRRLLDGAPQDPIELLQISPPLFAENLGQWSDTSVRYALHGPAANVLMTDTGPVFQLLHTEPSDAGAEPIDPAIPFPIEPSVTQCAEFSVAFDGANAVAPVGVDQAETVYNYFLGDQSNWHANVPTFQKVAYSGLYNGIDLLTSGTGDGLKYEFHVAPGADYQQIQMTYTGVNALSLDADGALHVQTSLGELIDQPPRIYQDVDGQQVEVTGAFTLVDADTCAFGVSGAYDPSVELVIDPQVDWAT